MSIHLIYIIKNDSNNDDHVHVMYDIFLMHVYIIFIYLFFIFFAQRKGVCVGVSFLSVLGTAAGSQCTDRRKPASFYI